MKKITSSKVQTALLRGAVMVSGCMATAIASVFSDSIYGAVVTLMVEAGMIALIDEIITNS